MMNRRFVLPILVILCASALRAQDTTKPPLITYEGSRTSAKWIETTPGNKVPVDKGGTWNGTTVYISLLWDLVATDGDGGKCLWSTQIGAFWNEFTFRELTGPDGRKNWVVELRPGPGSRAPDLRQYHDLKTGALVQVKDTANPGTKLSLVTQFSGDETASDKPLTTLIESADQWQKLVLKPYFEALEKKPDFQSIDFERHIVVAVLYGTTTNCAGLRATAFENADRVLLRIEEKSFQTCGDDGGGIDSEPYGIFVLPRDRRFKDIVIETNHQNLIGGPAIWREFHRFPKAK